MAEEKPRGEKDIRIWKFVVTYVLLMGLFLLLIGLEPVKKILDINGVYTEMIIYLTAWILEPFNIVQGISGSVINVKGLTMDVRFGCNGLEAFLIYTVAILAFPAQVRKKIVGIVGGFLVLQILNVLRIAGLGLSGVYLKKYFEYLHIYVAQGIMIAVALVLFLFWLNYATGKSD
ncbi:exosortase H [Desulfatiglans anilini]|uniref:exosortase H n=1 Tax=Desulfatiglans anilini TaxID=90728 RepID=UPI00041412F2|nr:exosortase H [Desulfatiglans anilini]